MKDEHENVPSNAPHLVQLSSFLTACSSCNSIYSERYKVFRSWCSRQDAVPLRCYRFVAIIGCGTIEYDDWYSGLDLKYDDTVRSALATSRDNNRLIISTIESNTGWDMNAVRFSTISEMAQGRNITMKR